MKKVIVIAGPTCTGKTKLAIEMGFKFKAEIVNFDSLVFYQELSIGTAKPTSEELALVKHHLVGMQSISSPLNANQFIKMALPIIEKLHQKNSPVILVGGSGFYLQALLEGMYEDLSTNEKIRQQSDELYNKEGIAPFVEILKENDLLNYQNLHRNDHYRIRRAVEYFWTTGQAFSLAKISHEQNKKDKNNWEILNFYIDIPKEEQWPLIQMRTKKMLEQGLIDEVKMLLAEGYNGQEKPLQSIGYKEAVLYLKNEIDLKQCEEQINIATRQLAKAQRTWFKSRMERSFHPILNHAEMFQLAEVFLKH